MPTGPSEPEIKEDRPKQLWVSDFTCVSTWQGQLYVAFVIDVFARRIVGWWVSCRMCTDFMLDALKQALYARQPGQAGALVHHSDRGCNISPFAVPSGSHRDRDRTLGQQQERQLWQRVCRDDQWAIQNQTGPKTEVPRNPGRAWSWPRWIGWPSLTTTGCWNPSGIYRQQEMRQTTTANSPKRAILRF